ncbi:substrate-binding domain-containing protein [Nocardia sp. NBC_01503]|uniref:substrate-binding domain-containing protein n=1 Tax=Nocardia sp. NBC_01503 TaxID=2975997 RepID=UPI002E7B8FEE|nr:substrate-binding domain-containing protein [Nocardia sp. NBC_01503]WTL32879.1 substrate-binding domain-containing protein [Nocardia sp. NBC_01503]
MLALIGIAVPVAAFIWEFVLVGRKRLGYRVQMDTPVTGEIESVFPGVLPQLRPDGTGTPPDLQDLSVVLMRIENNGATDIDNGDYAVPDAEPVGVHIHFPNRRVIGMAVTELSDDTLGDSLRPGTGIGTREDAAHRVGIIDLPKVPLNRGDHYKILAILQRSSGSGEYPPPTVRAKLKGGRVAETRSNSGRSPRLLALIGFLVAVVAIQYVVGTGTDDAPVNADCTTGKLTLVGSSAFEPAIRDAAAAYQRLCAGADFGFEFDGSERGLSRVDDEGKDNPALLAINDGPKGVGYPNLQPRTLALSLFTVIVNPGVGVRDLSVRQIRDIYAGRVDNWQLVGGPNLPVRVIHRALGSGSRETFRARVLGDEQPPAPPATSCRTILATNPPGASFCEVPVTKDMLKAVAEVPGAIGYAENTDAAKASDVQAVTIGGHSATREQVLTHTYPLWNVEYAYSNGELPADSLAAAFLRYLTDLQGKDVLRSYGNTPCTELANPTSCQPTS